MTPEATEKHTLALRVLLAVVFIAALYNAGAYLLISVMTVPYPYQMEWLEGSAMQTISRIYHQQPLFVAPTLEYQPMIYAPLYFYVTAAFSAVFGLDLTTARLVSCLSTYGSCVIIFLWLKKEGLNKIWSFIGVGLFLACYDISTRWFNVARVDSLCLLLMLLGLYIYYFRTSTRTAIVSGLLMAAACWTKQHVAFIFLLVLLAGLAGERRRTLITGATLAAGGVIPFVIGNIMSDGWMYFYLVHVPRTMPKDFGVLNWFWSRDIFAHYVPAFLLWVAGAILFFLHRQPQFLRYGALFLGGLIAGCYSRMHLGGWPNVLIPAYAIFAIITPIYAKKLYDHSQLQWRSIGLLLLLFQFIWLYFPISDVVPGEKNYKAGKKYFNRLAKMNGEVFITNMEFFPEAYGQTSYAFRSNLMDLENADTTPAMIDSIRQPLARYVVEQRFSYIIADAPDTIPGLDEYYREVEPMLSHGAGSYLITGAKVVPNRVFVPR